MFKVSEIFYSLQGEGLYTGTPSIFLRLYGCNFRCAGFGMPKGQLSTEADEIAKHALEYTDISQVPLVKTGCDSFVSWHPAFKHLSSKMTNDEICSKIQTLLPYHQWNYEHLIFTGGEPLLIGLQKRLVDFLLHEFNGGLNYITFETNGTQRLTQEFMDFLYDWSDLRLSDAITFSVSPKLSNSGESKEQSIQPEVIALYQQVGQTYLKFVIGTEEDMNECLDVIELYRDFGFEGDVYVMPVGGEETMYNLNKCGVAKLALKHGLKYSDRLQISLFKNNWGT
jgi:organic radical activating enzyme